MNDEEEVVGLVLIVIEMNVGGVFFSPERVGLMFVPGIEDFAFLAI